MMQSADVRDLDDRAAADRLLRPASWCILVQREMGAPVVIVGEVLLEVTAERAFVPHDDVVEALAPQGADHALHERILPGRTRRRQHFVDAHGPRDTLKGRAVDPIAVADEESGRGVPRPHLAELLRSPRRSRMRCHVEVDDAPAVVRQYYEHNKTE